MRTLRILVADDHGVVREGTRLLIERVPGWEVCGVAKTGREALEQAKRLQPDIVVLDMSMPELNGLDAARQIKRALPRLSCSFSRRTNGKKSSGTFLKPG